MSTKAKQPIWRLSSGRWVKAGTATPAATANKKKSSPKGNRPSPALLRNHGVIHTSVRVPKSVLSAIPTSLAAEMPVVARQYAGPGFGRFLRYTHGLKTTRDRSLAFVCTAAKSSLRVKRSSVVQRHTRGRNNTEPSLRPPRDPNARLHEFFFDASMSRDELLAYRRTLSLRVDGDPIPAASRGTSRGAPKTVYRFVGYRHVTQDGDNADTLDLADATRSVSFFARQLYLYSTMRRGERSSAASRSFTAPLLFAGYDPNLGLFVAAFDARSEDPPVLDRAVVAAGIRDMLLVGVYPADGYIKNVEGSRVLAPYRLTTHRHPTPIGLVEIPKSIRRAMRKIVREVPNPVLSNLIDAWHASGGASWARSHGFDRFIDLARREEKATIHDATLNAILSKIQRRRQKAVPSDPNAEGLVQPSWFEQKRELGAGAYGTVYKMPLTATNRHYLDTMRMQVVNLLEFAPIPNTGSVVVKFESLKKKKKNLGNWNLDFESVGEAYVQQMVHDNGGVPKTKRALPVVAPRVYFSGDLVAKTGFTYRVIVMEEVNGVRLRDIIHDDGVTKHVQRAVEEAVRTLLRNGVTHNDLHSSNVLISGKGAATRATIIDFGMARIIPTRLRNRVTKMLNAGSSVHEAVTATGLQNAINAEMRNYPYYHTNRKMVQWLRYLVDPNTPSPKKRKK